MRMKLMGIGLAAAGALVAFSASAADELTIGVSHQGLGFPYAVALQNGELKAAKELGVKAIDLDAQVNTLTQANQIDKLIAQKVDGILIDPGDSIAAMDWVDKANAAGIPIASMGVWVGNPKEHEPPWVYPGLVALGDRNDIENGYAVGKLAAADNPNGGEVVIVEGLPGFAAVIWRTKGFMKALDESGKKFDVVVQQPANWNPETAHQICQDALQAHPNVSVFFVQDQAMALGCLPAVKAAKSDAHIYTIDFSQAIKSAILDGEPIVTTCAEPETSGYQAMTALVNYIRTKQKPADPYLTYKWSTIGKDNTDACPIQF